MEYITKEDREWALAQYPHLKKMIDNGQWEYSPSKLKSDFDAFRLTTWVEVHPILTALIFITACLLGIIPAIVFAAMLFLSKTGRENYEIAILKVKRGSF